MPLVLSQIVDARNVRDERRLGLFGSIPHLRAVDFYLTREDMREARSREGDLRRAFAAAALSGRVVSARVFLPPYAPRNDEQEYTAESYAEVDRSLDVADWLREALHLEEIALNFHHVTEWPLAVDDWTEDKLTAALEHDQARGFEFAAEVASRSVAREVIPLLENVAPVRNDHPVPGAKVTPRYETGFCGPRALRDACDRIDGLGVALDVCHLALGYEAEREGGRPWINVLELERESAGAVTPPYNFAEAIETLGPYVECVHVSGCGGSRKEIHEGQVPGEPGDTIDLGGLLQVLSASLGSRTLPVVVEIREGHTDTGFVAVETALRRVSAALEGLTSR
jgi:hypothetical protein